MTGKRRIIAINTILFATISVLIFGNGIVSAAERMSVSVPVANIRSGPGTNYDILWKVEQFHPIKIVSKSGVWYKFVDFEDDQGWIHKSLLSSTDTVIVRKSNCNVRSGPGLDNDVVFQSERGVPFKVLDRQGDWVRIQHADGDTGWIHKALVW